MPIDDPKTKSMPLPKYTAKSNNIASEFSMVQKSMEKMAVPDNYAIERQVAAVPRTGTEKKLNNGIQPVTIRSTGVEPKVPDTFPQTADYIKSLDFNVNQLSKDGKENLAKYYNLVLQLMNEHISVPEYYAQMPSIMESIKGAVLTETDWEDLRDAILRTQNYILNFLWTDMQNICKAMDKGFEQYQTNINKWVDETNSWYNGDSYLPKDVIKLENLSNTSNGTDRHQIAQNITDLMNGMCTRISGRKPELTDQNPNGPANVNHFPTNKQLVWLEMLSVKEPPVDVSIFE